MPVKSFDRCGNQATQDHDDSTYSWSQFAQIFRQPAAALPQPWCDLFGPLRTGTIDDLLVVGQLGQSLDGRIATESGHSKYINGPAGLVWLDRRC